MCGHPREAWVGTADGIYCSACGARIDLDKTEAPAKTPEAKAEAVAELARAEEKPKKAAPKKGGKK